MEEINRLERLLPQIKTKKMMTPLMGGGLDSAYEFMGDMVLARKIFERIVFCDPSASKFPQIKRTIANRVQGKIKMIKMERLLGMVIHASYIVRDSSDQLDVINDLGERFIGSYKEFMSTLESLLLEYNDIIIAMCGIVRRQIQNIEKAHAKLVQERKKIGGSIKEQKRQISEKQGLYFKAHENYYKQIESLWSGNVGYNLDWLLEKYCGNDDLAKKILQSFFPTEYQNGKTFYRFYSNFPNVTNDRYTIKLGGAWGKENDERGWLGRVDVCDLLSIIEEYTEEQKAK